MKLDRMDGYYLSQKSVAKVESLYNAVYMGAWAIKLLSGGWSGAPVDVFYVAEPDTSKGHKHYFGLFIRDMSSEMRICDATSAFSEPISGIEEDGTVYVSHYRHDLVKTPSGGFIDGGRDYCRTNVAPNVKVTVEGSEFKFETI